MTMMYVADTDDGGDTDRHDHDRVRSIAGRRRDAGCLAPSSQVDLATRGDYGVIAISHDAGVRPQSVRTPTQNARPHQQIRYAPHV